MGLYLGDIEIGGGSGGDTIPIGSIFPFAGTNVPTGWLLCDGSAFDGGAYPALAAAIGGTFGTNVPDLRDRFAMGASGTTSLGTAGGSATTSTVAAHSHGISGTVTVDSAGAMTVSGTATADPGSQNTGQNHGHSVNASTLNHTHTAPAHTHAVVGVANSGGDHDHGVSSIGKNTTTQTGGTNQRLVDGGTSAGIRTNTGGAHTHNVTATAASAGGSATTGPSGYSGPTTHTNGSHWHYLSGQTSAHGHSASHSLSATSTGDASVDILNPFLAINYIIKAA